MDEMTFTLLKIVVSVCASLITVFAIPYLRRLTQNEKTSGICEAIQVAVSAAEQTITGSGKGKDKKEMALQYVTEWMNKHGVKISPEQLDGLIEAAVYGLNQGGK